MRAAVVPLAGTEAGRTAHSRGAGGDTTVEVDRVAESIVFSELSGVAEQGEKFSVLSEEAGHRDFGAPYPLVVVDPVDGSLNAKQGIPLFGLMMAVLDGPAVGDALAGMVVNLSTGDEWGAVRNQGAWLNGEPMRLLPRSEPGSLEVVGLESRPRSLKGAQPLIERASKLRILGSMAIAITLTSGGSFDAFCAPIPVRVFDMAASLLVLSETGGIATTIEGQPLGSLRCDLTTNTSLLCAPTRELHAEALQILSRPR